MLLEKSENLLEFSVKHLVVKSSLASSISLDQTMVCEKPNVTVVCSKVRFFPYPTRVILSKRFVQVVLCQLFQEIYIRK